jgi:Transposase DDE domain
MESVSQMAHILSQVLETEANCLARETGWQQRERKLSGADFVQTLIFGWFQEPEISLDGLTQVAARREVFISSSGFNQRFTQEASELLRQVLHQLVSQQQQFLASATWAMLRPFAAVLLEDSSTIALPEELAEIWLGTQGLKAALKLFVRVDLRNGTLQGPMLTTGRHSEKRSPLALEEVPVGGLSIADLGFADGARFRQLHGRSANQRRYFLTRWPPRLIVQTRSKHRIDLRAMAPKQVGERLEMGVVLPTAANLPVRLIMERVPEEVAEQRRERVRREAHEKKREASEESLFWCEWSIVLTNVPRRLLNFEQVFILLAARWQIERLFCQWKEDGQVDRWRSYDPWRILCEVYAKLCAMVIQQWLIQLGCWHDPMHSAVKAAQVCRREAGRIMVGLQEGRLETVLRSVLACMRSGCRLNSRQTQPNTAQMLAGVSRPSQPRTPPKQRPRRYKDRKRTWACGQGWARRGGRDYPPKQDAEDLP